ncbi:secreted protein [gut metagenome]|uniref:Secreted protein n=1 Tax=gut metagenome TaxID=749906 RepID=J9FKI0_9ZZZZ
MKSPQTTRNSASPNSLCVILAFLYICGMKSLARTIGPATNCGKKET